MWSVVFYVEGGVPKVLDRFGQRGEAEAYRESFVRLVGEKFASVIEVKYEEVEAAA